MSRIIVAGHLCVDIIPGLSSTTEWAPGRLIEVGPPVISTGGAVSNVGLALARLGCAVRLIAEVGTDMLGRVAETILSEQPGDIDVQLSTLSEQPTSYTVVLNRPGEDRMFLHHPGANDFFGPHNLMRELLPGATHLHFGYPPLMRQMYQWEGAGLAEVLAIARNAGMTTSLDLSLPDPTTPSGQAPWQRILARVLPLTDVFTPSEDELIAMIGPGSPEGLIDWSLEHGARTVLLKRGDKPLWVASGAELREIPLVPVPVVGTTGSGDATIAGFLSEWTRGASLQRAGERAVWAGAMSCTAADAVSGIPIQSRP